MSVWLRIFCVYTFFFPMEMSHTHTRKYMLLPATFPSVDGEKVAEAMQPYKVTCHFIICLKLQRSIFIFQFFYLDKCGLHIQRNKTMLLLEVNVKIPYFSFFFLGYWCWSVWSYFSVSFKSLILEIAPYLLNYRTSAACCDTMLKRVTI